MSKKVCHITTVHPRFDTRIFHKECMSLSKKYEMHLIVADGLGDEKKNDIHIHDIGLRQTSRLKRAKIDTNKAFIKALELNCDLYHLHDPELIKIGVKLKKAHYKVIYDVHEDLPLQIYAKPYLHKFVKPLLSKFIEWHENKAAKQLDCICTATPFIQKRFLKVNKNSVDIKNYPILGELNNDNDWEKKKDEVCYIGGITKVRGIKEMIQAIELTQNITLHLVGSFSETDIETEVKSYHGWEKVKEAGFLNRNGVAKVLNSAKAGLVTLHPIINYQDALPVKMFEYMIAGIPVISSNIPLWQTIIDENKCGICVNPFDIKEIAQAIEFLVSNPKEAKKMGENGRIAIQEKYNWSIEEKKLFRVYHQLLNE